MNKKIILALLFIFSISILSAQESNTENEDKFSVVNVMLTRITDCRYGMILEYFHGIKLKKVYIPNQFLIDGRAIKVVENDVRVSPQMNIIYKNFEPFKVKLYLAKDISNLTYQFIDYVPPELAEKFNITELTFDFE